MKGITGFRLRSAIGDGDAKNALPAVAPYMDADALARLRPKIVEMAARFDSMSDEEFDQWLDALPQDEFFEWIGLGAEGIGAVIREARLQARRAA